MVLPPISGCTFLTCCTTFSAICRITSFICPLGGNCYDNAVAESFFQLLKRERIKRKVYTTREQARADVFDYIEMFYNPKRRHGHAADMSPRAYEKQYFLKNGTV